MGSDKTTVTMLTILITAWDGHAECWLNWNVYDSSVNHEFNMICMQKMIVIAQISCYCHYSERAQRLLTYRDIQYNSLSPE